MKKVQRKVKTAPKKRAKRPVERPERKQAHKVATPEKSQLIVQPHGGAIWSGAPANPVAGPGRPPSAIRARAMESFDQRLSVLENVADGEVINRIEVPLLALLLHAHCPKCGEALKADDPDNAAMITVEGKVSAGATDRIRAVDALGKYGLGAKGEVEHTGEVGLRVEVIGPQQASARVVDE